MRRSVSTALAGLAALACAVAAILPLSGCGEAEEALEVEVSFNATQYEQAGPDWIFPFYFPHVVDQAAGIEYASTGNYLGATIVQVNIHTSEAFFITGVRVKDVRYRAANSSCHVDYVHPTLGKISPVYPSLPTSNAAENPFEAIEILPDADNVFEVGLSTVLSMYDSMDYDCDGSAFTADEDEVITLEGGLYFEGFFQDGREFGNGFPMPLHLTMTVGHGIP